MDEVEATEKPVGDNLKKTKKPVVEKHTLKTFGKQRRAKGKEEWINAHDLKPISLRKDERYMVIFYRLVRDNYKVILAFILGVLVMRAFQVG